MMFHLLIVAVALACVAGVVCGFYRFRDPLHPLVYLMPMAGFLYVYIPLSLGEESLLLHFSQEEITYAQTYYLACVVALFGGCYVSSWKLRRVRQWALPLDTPLWQHRLGQLAWGFGGVAVLAYAYQIINVGGFYAAYESVKGGGWASSGYLRELSLLAVPAIVLYYLSRQGKSWEMHHWLLLLLFATPLLVHGVIGARRGPTFLALAALIGGWYLAHRTRPSVVTLLTGGAGIGILLLVLVAFRGDIYLGSDFLRGDTPPAEEMIGEAFEARTQANFGNEFMYGTYVLHNARETGHYWQGRRYLTQVFVRPVPSGLWPNKYEAVGMEAIEENAGALGPEGRSAHPHIPIGSAPGFAASEFVEWGWGGVVFIFLLGWLYGFAWQRAASLGGFWTIHYVALMALSVFFIAQSFLAVFFRYAVMMVPTALLWHWSRQNLLRNLKQHERRIGHGT